MSKLPFINTMQTIYYYIILLFSKKKSLFESLCHNYDYKSAQFPHSKTAAGWIPVVCGVTVSADVHWLLCLPTTAEEKVYKQRWTTATSRPADTAAKRVWSPVAAKKTELFGRNKYKLPLFHCSHVDVLQKVTGRSVWRSSLRAMRHRLQPYLLVEQPGNTG